MRREDGYDKRRNSHIYCVVDLLLHFDEKIRLRDVSADPAVVVRQLPLVPDERFDKPIVKLNNVGVLSCIQ